MTISERIANLAKDRGIKQIVIAEICGVTPATVTTWIKGNAESIPSGHIVPIANLLGCSPLELLTGSRYSLPELGGEVQRLVDMFEGLDWEGQRVVIATAISESRRMTELAGAG